MYKYGFTNFTKFINQVINTVRQAQNKLDKQGVYKLVGHELDENGDVILAVQMTCKNIGFKCTPEEILADDNLIDGFSRKAIRIITYLACTKNNPESTVEIVQKNYNKQTNKLLFSLKNKKNKRLVKATANEIISDKELLSKLNKQDIHTVSYIGGLESIIDENNQIDKL